MGGGTSFRQSPEPYLPSDHDAHVRQSGMVGSAGPRCRARLFMAKWPAIAAALSTFEFELVCDPNVRVPARLPWGGAAACALWRACMLADAVMMREGFLSPYGVCEE